MKLRITMMAAVAIAIVAIAAPANAAVMTFFGEDLGGNQNAAAVQTAHDDFFSFLVGAGTEDFEGFTLGETAPIPISFGAAGTATITGDGDIDNGGAGRFATSGSQYWEVTGSFNVGFSDPVAAFGFYATDIGDFTGQVLLTFNFEGGGSEVVNIGNTISGSGVNSGSVLYFGYINTDNLITSVSFGNTNAGTDFFGFDDMTVGSLEQVTPGGGGTGGVIPEPATMALLGMGLVGIAARKTKRA